MSQLDTADEMIASLRAQVSSLTAENERLRKERDDLEAGKGELYDDLLRTDAALQAFVAAHQGGRDGYAFAEHLLELRKAIRGEGT